MSSLTITVSATEHINGEFFCPSDKSISHRVIMMSALATGVSQIVNLLDSTDVLSTIECFKQFGVNFSYDHNVWSVQSNGYHQLVDYLKNQQYNIDFGNSGTSCRLISGVLSSIERLQVNITGDNSLKKRPMHRIIEPLILMGANIKAIDNNYLPMQIYGQKLQGVHYTLNIASAQVKSCIMFAGLFAQGETVITGNINTRNHTELLMQSLKLPIKVANNKIVIKGDRNIQLPANLYTICGDFSSASFFIVLALIVHGSLIRIKNVGLNYWRTGLLRTLLKMGANIEIEEVATNDCLEPVGHLIISTSALHGVKVDVNDIANMIDEIPILAIAAVFAKGQTYIPNLHELQYKESNRLVAIVCNLKKMGINIVINDKYGLLINGKDRDLVGGKELDGYNDHRIAMALVVLGSRCQKPIKIHNCNNIDTSFPNFFAICAKINFLVYY